MARMEKKRNAYTFSDGKPEAISVENPGRSLEDNIKMN
jgi:hypothetical protein